MRDINDVLPFLFTAWLRVQGEDKSDPIDITIDGKPHRTTEIEAILYWYLDSGYKIKLAIADTVIVGIIVYNWVFEGLMAIRMLYTRPEFVLKKATLGLINSCGVIKQITYQTRKDIDPESMWKVTKGRQNKLFEDDKLVTWIMPWEA